MIEDHVMADLNDVVKLVQDKYPNDPDKRDRAISLTAECWSTLEPDVQQAYLAQLGSNTIGEPTLKAGVANFVADMSRAINSFPVKKAEKFNALKNVLLSKNELLVKTAGKTKKANQEALENFQDLNRSKHSTEPQVFDTDSLMESINGCPEFKEKPALAAGIATQVVTLTTSEPLDKDSQKALNQATTNILNGLLTKDNTNELNNNVDKFGRVNPDLVIAAANYAKENLESLRELDNTAQRNIGGQLKKASSTLTFVIGSQKSQLLATKLAFNTVRPPAAKAASKRHSVSSINTAILKPVGETAPNTPDASPTNDKSAKQRSF
jgi:hypothetical protein